MYAICFRFTVFLLFVRKWCCKDNCWRPERWENQRKYRVSWCFFGFLAASAHKDSSSWRNPTIVFRAGPTFGFRTNSASDAELPQESEKKGSKLTKQLNKSQKTKTMQYYWNMTQKFFKKRKKSKPQVFQLWFLHIIFCTLSWPS